MTLMYVYKGEGDGFELRMSLRSVAAHMRNVERVAIVGSGFPGWLSGDVVRIPCPSPFRRKQMNILLLGDRYARNLGINIQRSRLLIICSSGMLVAIVTAYCGPIMFIGLAVPHLCRGLWHTNDHRILMPATLLVGALLALFCNLVARLPGYEGALPVNSVTALIGAPVVATILFRKRNR